jgi:hypothetical protein
MLDHPAARLWVSRGLHGDPPIAEMGTPAGTPIVDWSLRP